MRGSGEALFEICCEEQHRQREESERLNNEKVGLIRWLGTYTDCTKYINFVSIQNYLKQGSASASFFPKIALQ